MSIGIWERLRTQFAGARRPRPTDGGDVRLHRPHRLVVLAAAAVAVTLPVQLAHIPHGTGGDDTVTPPTLAPDAGSQVTHPGTETPVLPKSGGDTARPNLSPDDSGLSPLPEQEPPAAPGIPRLSEDQTEDIHPAQIPSSKTPAPPAP